MSLVATKSPYVLGIDLGTSTSIVSVFCRQKSTILKVDGEDSMPSCVSFIDENTKLVGAQAKNRAIIAPESTILSIKTHMGEDYSVNILGEDYTPEQISGDILLKLVDEAMNQPNFDSEGDLRYAVICVPANFNENAKIATRRAAEIAGLEVLYLLEEPVAASIMYGFKEEKDQNILVYDLGGGTFDVCILRAKTSKDGEYNYEILAKGGISKLGGDNFDSRIMKILNDKFKNQYNVDLLNVEIDQGISIKKIKQAKQKLKEASERAKISLSEMDYVDILVPNIIENNKGEILHLELEFTRDEFEDSIKDLVQKTKLVVEKSIEDAKLNLNQIDKIILVGGSTFIPLIKNSIKKYFNKEPFCNFNPRTIVAEGAAVFGATLKLPKEEKTIQKSENESETLPQIELIQQVTYNLGIMISGMRFSKIIEKGRVIPPNKNIVETREYTTQYDNQTELNILVYQAEKNIEYINEKDKEGDDIATFIGEFKLKGISKSKRGKEKIIVMFEVNDQNEIKVSALDKTSGNKEEISLTVEKI